jgi:AcrR family transcriptional regulator
MPRKPDPTLKPAIIEKVALHLRDTKIEDVSVRSLGRVLGTSAYPIVYHFGSRDALIDAVVEHLAGVATATLDPGDGPAALEHWLAAVFGGLDDPERALAVRLAFELGAVESLDGRDREHTAHRAHVATIAAWCQGHGLDRSAAERAAHDAVTAARGLQWASLVDPDHTDVDAGLRTLATDLVARAAAAAAEPTGSRTAVAASQQTSARTAGATHTPSSV